MKKNTSKYNDPHENQSYEQRINNSRIRFLEDSMQEEQRKGTIQSIVIIFVFMLFYFLIYKNLPLNVRDLIKEVSFLVFVSGWVINQYFVKDYYKKEEEIERLKNNIYVGQFVKFKNNDSPRTFKVLKVKGQDKILLEGMTQFYPAEKLIHAPYVDKYKLSKVVRPKDYE